MLLFELSELYFTLSDRFKWDVLIQHALQLSGTGVASETEIGGMSLLNGNYFSHTDQADLYRFIFSHNKTR